MLFCMCVCIHIQVYMRIHEIPWCWQDLKQASELRAKTKGIQAQRELYFVLIGLGLEHRAKVFIYPKLQFKGPAHLDSRLMMDSGCEGVRSKAWVSKATCQCNWYIGFVLGRVCR